MTEESSAGASLWPEHWAIFAATEADYVEHRVRTADATATAGNPRSPSAEAVAYHLAAARAACHRSSGRWHRRRSILDRWRGASVERAYRNLHSAKIFLVDLLPQAEVDALIPDVSARIALVLDRDDPRRTETHQTLRSPDAAVRRAALKQAMENAYEASDDEYVRVRDFRNVIVLTAIALTLFTGILVAAVSLSPKAIPLCFEATTGQTPQGKNVCPSGYHSVPKGGDVLIVAALGAVGGGLGALMAICSLRGTSTPFGVPTALAVLKAPAGALTSVIGILLLAGGFVPGLSNLDSQRQILAYALLFGYGQQVITRMADHQAQHLLNRLPSKDLEAQHPAPSPWQPEPELATTVPSPNVARVRSAPDSAKQGGTGQDARHAER